MAAIDKLELIANHINPDIAGIAKNGPPKGGYKHYVDLRKTELKLPVKLFHLGYRGTPVTKLVFVRISRLSFRRVRKIVRSIVQYLPVRIYRVDFALDIPGVSARELHQHCLIARVQKSATFNSASGFSSYPRFSQHHKILLYDKRLKLSNGWVQGVRVEVQFSNGSVPIRRFKDFEEYAQLNVLEGVEFLRFRAIREDLTPLQKLAACGMQSVTRAVGLQVGRKVVPASTWVILRRKLFEPHPDFHDIPARMRDGIDEWIRGVRRFPRTSDDSAK
jgi:hypothetical protein